MGITNGLLTLPTTPPYKGQIPNSFNYPFTIVLTSQYGSETGTAVLTFYNSTNYAHYLQLASGSSGGKVNWYISKGQSYKY